MSSSTVVTMSTWPTTTEVPATTNSPIITFTPQVLVNLIVAGYEGDLSGCLLNCTNNGYCYQNEITEEIGCLCHADFAGTACETDMRACSSFPCLNGASCIDTYDNTTIDGEELRAYTCNCTQFYVGANCERKLDICADKLCSGHGSCVDTNNTAVCKCFSQYYGAECENQDDALKVTKKIIQSTSIIAIATIVTFYFLFILSDIHTKMIASSKRKRTKKEENQQTVQVGIYKYKYVN